MAVGLPRDAPKGPGIVVDFSGWFQIRLATDPDPTDERRGISGFTFALPDEPDLDRVIQFQPTVLRSHGPATDVGVKVKAVYVDGVLQPSHPLLGAPVELLGSAKEEQHNYALMGYNADDGMEAIDPMRLSIVASPRLAFERDDYLDPKNPNTTLMQASVDQLAHRGFWGGGFDDDASVFRRITGYTSFVSYRRVRRSLVERDLADPMLTDPVKRASLMRRLSELSNPDTGDRRTQRLGLWAERTFPDHQYKGPPGINGAIKNWTDADNVLAAVDKTTPWPLSMMFGAFDCDANLCYCDARLMLPTQ